jgi:hypothetical protein
MLRDDRAGGEGRRQAARNVLGETLEICSFTPMTGFYRDGLLQHGARGLGQSYGLRRDDFRISRVFQIARQ